MLSADFMACVLTSFQVGFISETYERKWLVCRVVEGDDRKGGKYLQCCLLQGKEKEVFAVIKVFKYKLKKILLPVFGKRGNPEERLRGIICF